MDESQELIYEESQVLWAKIRGYPWWPAYVSDVHEADSPSDYEYTVIFFGDNTKYFYALQKVSSRLGPSKLRKFPEHYAECFVKAKTNKKLRQSIQKAEQRLSENQQDISYYENIRNDLNLKRKKNGAVSESRLSSSEKGDPQQAPDLVKHRTQQPIRNRKRAQAKKDEEIFEQQSAQNLQNSKSGRSNQKPIKHGPEMRRGRSEKLPPTANIKKIPIKQQQLIQRMQQQSPQEQPRRGSRSKEEMESPPKIERERYNMRSNQKSKDKFIEEENNQEKEESVKEVEDKSSPVKATPVKPRKGRKGRPPKHQKMKQKQQQQQQQSDEQEVQLQPVVQQLPKTRKKPLPLHQLHLSSTTNPHPSSLGSQVVSSQTSPFPEYEVLVSCLPSRSQLLRQLYSTQIQPGNIKQILDLGVSVILQNGPITKNIHLMLLLLKATLLYKYFPDNNKYRKKYEKLSKEKKKVIIPDGDQDDDEEVEDIGSFEELDKNRDISQDKDDRNQMVAEDHEKGKKNNKISSNKQNKQQNRVQKAVAPESAGERCEKLTQIRKKANQKLQKMIRKTGLQEKAKDYALRIQDTFQNTADLQGEQYRNVAYRRMRNLKTKLLEFCDRQISTQEVVSYLEEIIGVYETEGLSTTKE